jgi:biotin transport system substrate-specific component
VRWAVPVFANTPPLTAGIPYLLGPTGGFLAGFALAAALVGFAADRGAMARPVLFALALIAAEAVMFGMGFLWLAFFAPIGTAVGLGAAKAWAVGIQPFLLGDAIKVALVATTLPLVWGALGRR